MAKLYRFDGIEIDEFEKNVQIPTIDLKEELNLVLDNFHKRRNSK